MKTINIICVGNLRERYWREAGGEYSKRIQKYCDLNITEIKESDRAQESSFILKKIEPRSYVFVCDICGNKYSSTKFAALISEKLELNTSLTFIIGGSDGVSEEVKKQANMLLSFSDMTFPHQMFRIFLLEQIYRSFKILKNEKYHK
jgi:23S rRNA (pseudouridine1915-N3)-methyltransferase